MPATASVGAHDRHADAGVAPEQLLVDDRQREAGRVGPELGDAPRSRRGRSWRPPGSIGQGVSSRSSHSCGGGAHDVLGEVVDPVADVLLVLGELHRERRVADLEAHAPRRSGVVDVLLGRCRLLPFTTVLLGGWDAEEAGHAGWASIRSPSSFSLPVMNRVGPLARFEASLRKLTRIDLDRHVGLVARASRRASRRRWRTRPRSGRSRRPGPRGGRGS